MCLTAIVSRWFRSRPSLKYLLIASPKFRFRISRSHSAR